eukprot:554777-Rhodomonas_salina.2
MQHLLLPQRLGFRADGFGLNKCSRVDDDVLTATCPGTLQVVPCTARHGERRLPNAIPQLGSPALSHTGLASSLSHSYLCVDAACLPLGSCCMLRQQPNGTRSRMRACVPRVLQSQMLTLAGPGCRWPLQVMGLAESSSDAIASKCQRYVAGGSIVLASIILIIAGLLWMCHVALKVHPAASFILPPFPHSKIFQIIENLRLGSLSSHGILLPLLLVTDAIATVVYALLATIGDAWRVTVGAAGDEDALGARAAEGVHRALSRVDRRNKGQTHVASSQDRLRRHRRRAGARRVGAGGG